MLVEKTVEELKAKDHLSVIGGCSSLLLLAEQTEAFLLLLLFFLLSLPRT